MEERGQDVRDVPEVRPRDGVLHANSDTKRGRAHEHLLQVLQVREPVEGGMMDDDGEADSDERVGGRPPGGALGRPGADATSQNT